LKQLYGVPSGPIMGGGFLGGGALGLGGGVGMIGAGPPPDPTLAPTESPLAPPLPPALLKRREGM
jgi:hypothetical protein